MKKVFSCLCIILGYSWLVYYCLFPSLPSEKNPIILYANSHQDDLKKIILLALKRAKTSIALQMYGLTDKDILQILEKKSFEGLEIAIFYDPKATPSLPPSIPTYPIRTSGLMHRKILTIDETTTFLGTANFTTQSLNLHDNLILGIYHPCLSKHLKESIDGYHCYQIGKTTLHYYLLPEKTNEALEALCKKIDLAEKNIQMALFTLTHPTLLTHLIDAKKRGVDVELALDRYAKEGSSKKAVEKLKKEGVDLFLQRGNTLFHHKWAWIDQKVLCLGSANWTGAAFGKNQDFLLIIEDLEARESNKLNELWQKIAKRATKG